MAVKVTWKQALAFRMERHLLDPIGTQSVPRVARRLCGVQAQVASSAELAVRVRREASRPGEVGRALSEGRLIKTWAMRGTLHLLTPENGGPFLSLAEVDVDGERAHVLADDLDELVSVQPTTAVRLLPGFDQYVLGPGTGDGHVVPAARRAAVSRAAGSRRSFLDPQSRPPRGDQSRVACPDAGSFPVPITLPGRQNSGL